MAAPTGALLHDLERERDLGLRAIVRGNPTVRIRSAYTVEVTDPGRWGEREAIILTTGVMFRGDGGDAEMADRLVTTLRQAGVVAIFFGLGERWAEVPPELVSAAQTQAFPLYTVAPNIPFYSIVNYITHAATSSEVAELKRSARLTRDLLQAIAADHPLDALIARLAHASRGTAALYEETGRVVASTGQGPIRLLHGEFPRDTAGLVRFSVGRWEALGKSLVMRGMTYRLVIATKERDVLEESGELLLDTTHQLVGVINGITRIAFSTERFENAQLLSSLQDGVTASREHRYWDRMRPFRFMPYESLRAAAIANHTGDPLPTGLVDGLLEAASDAEFGVLLSENSGASGDPASVHALVSDVTHLSDWFTLATQHHLVVGVSEPFSDLGGVPMAFREAETACAVSRRRMITAGIPHALERNVVRLDDVDLATWLLARREMPQLADKIRKFLTVVTNLPGVAETVVAFLAHDLDIARTARHLFLHPNTVRYRLRKYEDALGDSISAAATITNLYLAFQDEVVALRYRIEVQQDDMAERADEIPGR